MSKIHGFSLLSDRLPSNLSKSTMLAVHHGRWCRRSLHDQWPQLMDRLKTGSFKCLQGAHLKPVAGALIAATQVQALHTHWLGFHILGSINSGLCM